MFTYRNSSNLAVNYHATLMRLILPKFAKIRKIQITIIAINLLIN
jgi:hypothetical protein